jgi:hypothetical protein
LRLRPCLVGLILVIARSHVAYIIKAELPVRVGDEIERLIIVVNRRLKMEGKVEFFAVTLPKVSLLA